VPGRGFAARVLKFTVPVVIIMGFCIGLIIPRAYRRYKTELLVIEH
jgi:hypothetical protein